MHMAEFGKFVKARRMALGIALSEFVTKHPVDSVNWSMMERGRVPPPDEEKLREYATYLELADGTADWYKFFDLARQDSTIVFKPLEGAELCAKLPVLFRTDADTAKHGGDDTDNLLDDLKTALRGAI